MAVFVSMVFAPGVCLGSSHPLPFHTSTTDSFKTAFGLGTSGGSAPKK